MLGGGCLKKGGGAGTPLQILELWQVSKMEPFAKKVKSFLQKSFILDFWQGTELYIHKLCILYIYIIYLRMYRYI